MITGYYDMAAGIFSSGTANAGDFRFPAFAVSDS